MSELVIKLNPESAKHRALVRLRESICLDIMLAISYVIYFWNAASWSINYLLPRIVVLAIFLALNVYQTMLRYQKYKLKYELV